MIGLRIADNVRIQKLKDAGYVVVKAGDLEGIKNTAPDIYGKIHEQGRKDERTQAGKHTEIIARAKARADEIKKLAEEKRPKSLKEMWDASPELRAEFGGNYDSYEAYFKNEPLTCKPKDDNTSIDQKAIKVAWDADPELRAEFNNNFATYEAYQKNAAAGNARIYQKKELQ